MKLAHQEQAPGIGQGSNGSVCLYSLRTVVCAGKLNRLRREKGQFPGV